MISLLLAILGLTVSSKVDSVVVYPNQVAVVRTAKVTVSGPGELVFPGLPGALQDNSVRIKAPAMKIGEVQVKRGYISEPTPSVKALEIRVKALEDSLGKIDDEQAVLKAKEEFLKSIKLGAPEIISKELQQGKVSAQSWRGALSFMADELSKANAKALKLKRKHEAVDKKLKAGRQEYQDARARIENRKEIRFDYGADAGTYHIRLSYIIRNGANWLPYYELRARPANGKVEVAYFAKLIQKTGEDWNRVKVVLSTARPMLGAFAPEPRPWLLSLWEQVRHALGGAQEKSVGFDKISASIKPMPPGAQTVNVVETGISLQYVIPGRVTLASGEPVKKLRLHETRLPAEFSYYTLAKAKAQAFLQGELVNATDFVFLAGEGNTYVGDEYTGSTYLPAVAPEESTEVSFGVDERVKVKRELVKSFKSRHGLFSKTEKMQFVYKTTVENYHPKPIKIRIVEQVPVSKQKEIKVTVTKVEPKFLEQDKDKGTYTWKPELEPKGKFEINLEFAVEYPTGRRVQGLY